MVPKYFSLKETINNEILSGHYPLGSKLPTEVAMASIYNVSRSTVRQALNLLVEEGIIAKRWGSGNIVISKSDNSKKNTVLFILPSAKSDLIKGLIEDVTIQLSKEGLSVELKETKGQIALERSILSESLKDIYGGIIIEPSLSALSTTNTDLIHILLKRNIPVLFLGAVPSDLENIAAVLLDSYQRGYQMARHFINKGHTALGGIFYYNKADSIKSFQGYVDAIRDADLSIYDSCFFWCSSNEKPALNRFFKSAYNTVSIVYVDNENITTDGTFPAFYPNLSLSKSLSKEVVKTFLALKKNGNIKTVTIPYKQSN